jgi:hypothetical protein
MKRLAWLLAFVPLSLPAVDIPLVGIGSDGSPVTQYLSQDDYVKRMSELLASVQETALPVLEGVHPMLHGNARDGRADRSWQLNTFTLGIGLNLSVGVGPVVLLAVAPAFTLVFCNANNPIIP